MGRHWRGRDPIEKLGCAYLFAIVTTIFFKFLFLVGVVGVGIWLGLKLLGVL